MQKPYRADFREWSREKPLFCKRQYFRQHKLWLWGRERLSRSDDSEIYVGASSFSCSTQ